MEEISPLNTLKEVPGEQDKKTPLDVTQQQEQGVKYPLCIRYCRKQFVCCMTFLLMCILLLKIILDGIDKEYFTLLLGIVQSIQNGNIENNNETEDINENTNEKQD